MASMFLWEIFQRILKKCWIDFSVNFFRNLFIHLSKYWSRNLSRVFFKNSSSFLYHHESIRNSYRFFLRKSSMDSLRRCARDSSRNFLKNFWRKSLIDFFLKYPKDFFRNFFSDNAFWINSSISLVKSFKDSFGNSSKIFSEIPSWTSSGIL